MKRMVRLQGMMLCAVMALIAVSCAMPRAFWPQKDVSRAQISAADRSPVVLMASRSSAFKEALVKKLSADLASQDIGVKIVGIGDLKDIRAEDYDAVVLINTCLAWGLDNEVQAFVDRYPRNNRMIVVTTSGEGVWLPQKEDSAYDAISSASNLTHVDAVAREVTLRLHPRLTR